MGERKTPTSILERKPPESNQRMKNVTKNEQHRPSPGWSASSSMRTIAGYRGSAWTKSGWTKSKTGSFCRKTGAGHVDGCRGTRCTLTACRTSGRSPSAGPLSAASRTGVLASHHCRRRTVAAGQPRLSLNVAGRLSWIHSTSFSISFSSITATPRVFALSSFDPASEPATT